MEKKQKVDLGHFLVKLRAGAEDLNIFEQGRKFYPNLGEYTGQEPDSFERGWFYQHYLTKGIDHMPPKQQKGLKERIRVYITQFLPKWQFKALWQDAGRKMSDPWRSGNRQAD